MSCFVGSWLNEPTIFQLVYYVRACIYVNYMYCLACGWADAPKDTLVRIYTISACCTSHYIARHATIGKHTPFDLQTIHPVCWFRTPRQQETSQSDLSCIENFDAKQTWSSSQGSGNENSFWYCHWEMIWFWASLPRNLHLVTTSRSRANAILTKHATKCDLVQLFP